MFQSAPPAWGATTLPLRRCLLPGVSIRAPRVGGDGPERDHQGHQGVSIRAPRVGGDRTVAAVLAALDAFQSAPPAWGATRGAG